MSEIGGEGNKSRDEIPFIFKRKYFKIIEKDGVKFQGATHQKVCYYWGTQL